MGFVANLVRLPAVQKFWKSVKIWQSYSLKLGTFLRHSVWARGNAHNIQHAVEKEW